MTTGSNLQRTQDTSGGAKAIDYYIIKETFLIQFILKLKTVPSVQCGNGVISDDHSIDDEGEGVPDLVPLLHHCKWTY